MDTLLSNALTFFIPRYAVNATLTPLPRESGKKMNKEDYLKDVLKGNGNVFEQNREDILRRR